MKRYQHTPLLILFVISFFTTNVKAQETSTFQDRIEFFDVHKLRDFTYFSFGGACLSEFWSSPVYSYTDEQREYFVFETPNLEAFVTIARVYTDFRVNIFQYYDMVSLSLNSPISIGFNIDTDGYDYMGSSVHFPLYLQANFLLNSTKIDIDRWGFYTGIGYQYFNYFKTPDPATPLPTWYYKDEGMFMGRMGFMFNTNSKIDLTGALDFTIGLGGSKVSYYSNPSEQITRAVNAFYGLSLHLVVF